ncbi:hypothetical protein CPT34_25955 [Rhizobium sophoriradicis]|uniref:Uncharacterized protein n=1 Tax=Rhizobium sophoriradicis TaxID=1535245 RepID=A0A2A5KME0_9HYPH|nr:hypothetical protein CPT34_25955 [Rhizobium sophoriradicis]
MVEDENYTASELQLLGIFIEHVVRTWRNSTTRSDLKGVASGCVFNVLKERHRRLARKVGSREGLVSVSRVLGFSINPGLGGIGLRGTGVWEFIDLPEPGACRSWKSSQRRE